MLFGFKLDLLHRTQRAAERVAEKRGWMTAKKNPKSQHSGDKQRVHGSIENHAIVIMGRIIRKHLPGETILYMNGKIRKMFSVDMRSSKEIPNTRLPNWEWPVT